MIFSASILASVSASANICRVVSNRTRSSPFFNMAPSFKFGDTNSISPIAAICKLAWRIALTVLYALKLGCASENETGVAFTDQTFSSNVIGSTTGFVLCRYINPAINRPRTKNAGNILVNKNFRKRTICDLMELRLIIKKKIKFY